MFRSAAWAAVAGVLLSVDGSQAFEFRRPLSPPRAFDVVAHRGAMYRAPENTRPAIEAAIEDGVEWIEVDIRRTRDGHHVLFHDERLDGKTNGSGLVRERTLADLKALDAGSWFAPRFAGVRVLTLEECLSIARGRVNLYLDCKGADPDLLVRQVVAAGMTDQVVVFDELERLRRVRECSGGAVAIMPKWRNRPGLDAWRRAVRPDAVEVDADEVTADLCRTFHNEGVRVFAKCLDKWDGPAFWDRVLAAGADCIQTDLAEELIAHAVWKRLRGRPVLMALHRGASRYAPENTLPAFEKAVRLGADLVELDVRTTRDGTFVLLHDADLDRTTSGRGPVRWVTSQIVAELDAGRWFAPVFSGTRVPTLEAFLAWSPMQVGLYVDAKDIPPEVLADILKRHRVTDRAIVYQTPEYLARLKGIDSRIRTLAPLTKVGGIEELAAGLGPYAVDVPWEYLSPSVIERAHRAGTKVFTDAPDQAVVQEYVRAIGWGVDAIQTDCPLRLIRAAELVATTRPGSQPTGSEPDARAASDAAAGWVERFAFQRPTAESVATCLRDDRGLPVFCVMPGAGGPQIVRVSLPFPPGSFPLGGNVKVRAEAGEVQPDVRVLTQHPGAPAFVRRAILTFPYVFNEGQERRFAVVAAPERPDVPPPLQVEAAFTGVIGELEICLSQAGLVVRRGGRVLWAAEPIAPARRPAASARAEVVEYGQHYLWARLLVPDALWPRIIEVRADGHGTVAARVHLQRLESDDGYAPDLGWRITGPTWVRLRSGGAEREVQVEPLTHDFSTGMPASLVSPQLRLDMPDAHLVRRGKLTVRRTSAGGEVTYLRCLASEKVPHQEAAWRQASFVLGPVEAAPWSPLLEPVHRVRIPSAFFDALYGSGAEIDLSAWPMLDRARDLHRRAIGESMLLGDDFGNVTSFPRGAFGMNRLNHCPPVFEEFYRCGDRRLREVALLWCDNFHDLSIWWGTRRPGEFGGTRYNNARKGDDAFMWRSNTAVDFCTKGYDSFFLAYEETGDPRMLTALRWQLDYAGRKVHADRGECRNIGDVRDFLRLYRYTGRSDYLRQAERLFAELRTRLSTGGLFSQGGAPLEPDPPFIDDDAVGYKHPFAKPYILGYALAGLPALAAQAPEQPRVREVVEAVADFLADSQDPVGGWRYPHPASGRVLLGQATEHAWQIAQAAELLGPRGKYLDAIERVLRQRLWSWQTADRPAGNLIGWEYAAGRVKSSDEMHALYERPADRDPTRDYVEGRLSFDACPPEGLAYFSEVLGYYLKHRGPDRLLRPPSDDEPLGKVLKRTPASAK